MYSQYSKNNYLKELEKKVNMSSTKRLGNIENTQRMMDEFISQSIEIKDITEKSNEIALNTLVDAIKV